MQREHLNVRLINCMLCFEQESDSLQFYAMSTCTLQYTSVKLNHIQYGNIRLRIITLLDVKFCLPLQHQSFLYEHHSSNRICCLRFFTREKLERRKRPRNSFMYTVARCSVFIFVSVQIISLVVFWVNCQLNVLLLFNE